MAQYWNTPNTSWSSDTPVKTTDLNRMEGNGEYIYDQIRKGLFSPVSVTYDSGTDTLTATFRPGTIRFGDSLVEKTIDWTTTQTPVSASVTYYIYIKSDGTTEWNASGNTPSGAVLLCTVSTDVSKNPTITDKRGVVDATGKIAQDNLTTHEAASDPHPQYKKDTAPPNSHANTHAIGGSDPISPSDIGAAPSSHLGSGGNAHALVTTSVHGFMSASDKSKLNGIESGATGDMTSSEILNALLPVDGSGSGLDADTVDGKHGGDLAEIASGTFTDTTTTIPEASTYTKTIPLGLNAIKGRVFIHDGTNGGFIIHFTRNENDAISAWVDASKVYAKAIDGILGASTNAVDITSCYISTTNLLIVFSNNVTGSRTLNLEHVSWEVEG